MDRLELFESLGVALGIGLLIGIERGWITREEPDGERALGLRTFALSGLLGGVLAATARAAGGDPALLLGLGFMAHAFLVGFFRWRELENDGSYGATTVVAALLVFALGAMAVLVDRVLAAACGVAAAGLLAFKPALHGWLRRLTWQELRAGIVLLAMSVILLPILPRQGPGPLAILDLRELWLLTVLLAAMSFAGYVAIKLAGDEIGVLLSGAAGGLTSSTATTVSLMRLARAQPGQVLLLTAGAAVAGGVMMLRVLALSAAVSPAVAAQIAAPLILGALAQGACAAVLATRARGQTGPHVISLGNPFDLAAVLKFGLLLGILMVLSRLAAERLGAAAAYALAAVSGIADVDAITLSMSREAGMALSAGQAAAAILIAVAVNTLVKVGLGWAAGGLVGGFHLAIAGAAGLAGLAAGYGVAMRFAA